MFHPKMKLRKALLQKTVLLYPINSIIPYVTDKSKSIVGEICCLEDYYYSCREKNSYFSSDSVICYKCSVATTHFIHVKN